MKQLTGEFAHLLLTWLEFAPTTLRHMLSKDMRSESDDTATRLFEIGQLLHTDQHHGKNSARFVVAPRRLSVEYQNESTTVSLTLINGQTLALAASGPLENAVADYLHLQAKDPGNPVDRPAEVALAATLLGCSVAEVENAARDASDRVLHAWVQFHTSVRQLNLMRQFARIVREPVAVLQPVIVAAALPLTPATTPIEGVTDATTAETTAPAQETPQRKAVTDPSEEFAAIGQTWARQMIPDAIVDLPVRRRIDFGRDCVMTKIPADASLTNSSMRIAAEKAVWLRLKLDANRVEYDVREKASV